MTKSLPNLCPIKESLTDITMFDSLLCLAVTARRQPGLTAKISNSRKERQPN